jgi:hypothetical protein
MSVERFQIVLKLASLGNDDKAWFGRWLRRYAVFVHQPENLPLLVSNGETLIAGLVLSLWLLMDSRRFTCVSEWAPVRSTFEGAKRLARCLHCFENPRRGFLRQVVFGSLQSQADQRSLTFRDV